MLDFGFWMLVKTRRQQGISPSTAALTCALGWTRERIQSSQFRKLVTAAQNTAADPAAIVSTASSAHRAA
jgi:hypothetical protein